MCGGSDFAVLSLWPCSYDNQLLMEYNVQCESGQLAFFNVTDIEIEGDQNCRDEDGNPRYVLHITGASVSESHKVKPYIFTEFCL